MWLLTNTQTRSECIAEVPSSSVAVSSSSSSAGAGVGVTVGASPVQRKSKGKKSYDTIDCREGRKNVPHTPSLRHLNDVLG